MWTNTEDKILVKIFKKRKGFTLVELIIVVVIIGVLAGAMALSGGQDRDKARYARAMEDISMITTAINLAAAETSMDTDEFVSGLSTMPTSAPSSGTSWYAVQRRLAKPIETLTDPWGNAYDISVNDQEITIYSAGPSGADTDEDGAATNPYANDQPLKSTLNFEITGFYETGTGTGD